MIKRRILWICILLGMGIYLPQVMNAQVAIGTNNEPNTFSLLELTSNTSGLRMPQLTTAQRDAIDMGSYAASEAKGLMIFNTDTKCMEFWNGTNWANTCGEVSPPAAGNVEINPTFNTSTDNKNLYTGAVLAGGVGDELTRGTEVQYANVNAGVFNYTGGEGQSLPRLEYTHLSGLRVVIPAQTLNGSTDNPAGGQITIQISGIPSAAYAGKAFDIPVALFGKNLTVRVNTGCGVYTGDKMATDEYGFSTKWMQFQCYNLGASTTIDPFSANQYLHGAKHRFGAKGPSLTMNEDQITSGNVTLWGDKQMESGNADWTTNNNPCPEGWYLPTRATWETAMNATYNKQTAKGTWEAGATNYNVGKQFGDALFLPAAGERASSNGSLSNRGLSGKYWSSTTYNSSQGYNFHMASSSNSVTNSSRSYGFSVRCVAKN